MFDLIIIGGGPAGIVAGIYAARKKLKTLILTKDFLGQPGLTGTIENWPGEKSITGPELMNKFEEHLKNYEIKIKEERVVSLEKNENFIVKSEEDKFFSRAVIITTGRKSKSLNIPGEEKFIGRGVVYCTTCDAPIFQNKKVIVVGGGNAGFESAIELTDYAREVSLFEASSQCKADEFLQDKAIEKGVKVFKNRIMKRIEGEKFLERIYYKDSTEEEKVMDVDGVFIQIGSVPVVDFVSDLVIINENGEIEINFGNCKTKTPGLFAAGDVTNIKDKQIIISAGEGAKSALSAYDYLKKNSGRGESNPNRRTPSPA